MVITRFTALIAAAMLIFAACGSGDSDTPAAPVSTTDTSADDAQDDDASHDDDVHDHGGAHDHDDGAHLEGLPEGAAVVEIEMSEFGYEPSEVTVAAGKPVRLIFTNVGEIEHEVMIGTTHEQEEFAGEGEGHGDHSGHHGDVLALTLDPGEAGHIDATFDEAADLLMVCHLPGHWAAGMEGKLTVS